MGKVIFFILLGGALLALILAPIYLSYLLIIKWHKLKNTPVEPDVPVSAVPIINKEVNK